MQNAEDHKMSPNPFTEEKPSSIDLRSNTPPEGVEHQTPNEPLSVSTSVSVAEDDPPAQSIPDFGVNLDCSDGNG